MIFILSPDAYLILGEHGDHLVPLGRFCMLIIEESAPVSKRPVCVDPPIEIINKKTFGLIPIFLKLE